MTAYGADATGPILIWFSASAEGAWRQVDTRAIRGPALAPAPRLDVQIGAEPAFSAVWRLKGVVSHLRYTTGAEAHKLGDRGAGLGRPEADRAVLIPIRKSPAWWALPQDERRNIYEEQSRHTSIGLEYLPQIARRLHHCRDLGEPFDFLTWFEFAAEHETAFDTLLARLRATEEWRYVDRETEIRLVRT